MIHSFIHRDAVPGPNSGRKMNARKLTREAMRGEASSKLETRMSLSVIRGLYLGNISTWGLLGAIHAELHRNIDQLKFSEAGKQSNA